MTGTQYMSNHAEGHHYGKTKGPQPILFGTELALWRETAATGVFCLFFGVIGRVALADGVCHCCYEPSTIVPAE